MRGLNASWRFDAADWWSNPAQAPLLQRNVVLVDSWSGYAASVAGLDPAWLVLPAVTASGHINLSESVGTWSAWFSPYWTSQALGGGGPGRPATLFEVGAWSSLSAVGWWSLQVAADGNSLAFVAMDGAERVEIARGPVVWRALDWHHVTLTYSALKTRIYVDGKLLAVGPGVALVPLTLSSGARGFALGSDALGGNLAQGQFDEVALFGVAREAREIAADYARLKDTAALGPVTAEEEAQGLARLLAQAEAAARGGAAAQTIGLDSEPCEELKVFIGRVPPGNHQSVRLTACGRKEDVTYTWWSTPNPPSPPSWEAWEWTAEMRPEDDALLFVDLPGTNQFFQLVESPHFYVSANAEAGGDGSRDLPFASLGAALASAEVTDGAVIVVLAGVYRGADNRNVVVGNKDVVLMSERGWETTIIDCENVAGSTAFICGIPSQYTRGLVLGFTITNAEQSAIICSGGSRPKFANCAFTQNGSTTTGGAVSCNNANPTLLNCRFFANSAGTLGGAIYAAGSGSRVRVSHCTFSANTRAPGGGTLYAAGAARIELINSIVWPAAGQEIVTASGGVVTAKFCDIAGTGVYPGTGNLNQDPLFEANNTLRLTLNSPCIDHGTNYSFPDCYVLVRHDMDGEARLDEPGDNQVSKVDIGADEFVYRLQFPLDPNTEPPNTFSVVDEISGVAFVGEYGGLSKVAMVGDENENEIYLARLNIHGTLENIDSIPLHDTQNAPDLEGVAFDPATGLLHLLSSQTKRNHYLELDWDRAPFDGPPTSDYDEDRTVLGRLGFPAPEREWNLQPMVFWRSEAQDANDSIHYDAVHGLVAHIRAQLAAAGAPFTDLNHGNHVLIAFNPVNKFSDPIPGHNYTRGELLQPGCENCGRALGDSRDDFADTGTFTHENQGSESWLQPNTIYHYRIWAFDGEQPAEAWVYRKPMTATVTTTPLVPTLYINELQADNPDWIELFNPAGMEVQLGGFKIADRQLLEFDPPRFFTLATLTVEPRAYRVLDPLPFGLGDGGDRVRLTDGAGTPGTPGQVTEGEMGNPIDDVEYLQDPNNEATVGRVWDGGTFGGFLSQSDRGDGHYGGAHDGVRGGANDLPGSRNFIVAPHWLPQGGSVARVYLTWRNIGFDPAVWRYSPKQNDHHPINIEGFAFCPARNGIAQPEMIIGLRSPLMNRTSGHAIYFRVNDVEAFLPECGEQPWSAVCPVDGINNGLLQVNLENKGFRAIAWDGHRQTYWIVAGRASGGRLEEEPAWPKFSLFSWDGSSATPLKVIDDLAPYTVNPEAMAIITVNGEQRVLFGEDRYRGIGYGARNAIHWPVSILGQTFQTP